jgi:hypothetical protein
MKEEIIVKKIIKSIKENDTKEFKNQISKMNNLGEMVIL